MTAEPHLTVRRDFLELALRDLPMTRKALEIAAYTFPRHTPARRRLIAQGRRIAKEIRKLKQELARLED